MFRLSVTLVDGRSFGNPKLDPPSTRSLKMIQQSLGDQALPEILSSQIGLLDQLIEIGQVQIQAIEHGRMSELLSLLSDKQPLLTDLGDVAHRIRKLNARQSTALHEDDVCVQMCRQLKADAKNRFELLFELEQRSEALLCTNRDQIAKRLEASSHSMTAISAYQGGATGQTQGGRLDLSSDG